MKKKMYIVLAVASIMALLSSCSPSQFVVNSTYEEKTAKELNPQEVVFITQPLMVDLTVEENKVTFDTTYRNALANGRTIDELRTLALYDMSQKYKADVIVLPVYSIISENGRDFKVKITGHSATYGNFRKVNIEDNKK